MRTQVVCVVDRATGPTEHDDPDVRVSADLGTIQVR